MRRHRSGLLKLTHTHQHHACGFPLKKNRAKQRLCEEMVVRVQMRCSHTGTMFLFLIEREASRQCGPVYQQPLDIFLHQVSYIFPITSAKSYQFILCLDQQSSNGPRYWCNRSLSLILAPQYGKEKEGYKWGYWGALSAYWKGLSIHYADL